MLVIRFIIILLAIAAFVLVIGFVRTRDRQYLYYLKQLLLYVAWFACLVGLLFLISRVILL